MPANLLEPLRRISALVHDLQIQRTQKTRSEHPDPQTLFFDADDTLWENNVYFEQAIAAFISFLDHRSHTPEEVRQHLNTCEHATIAQYGYGLRSFRRSLISCFEQLTERSATPETHTRIERFADVIADAEITLLPRVRESLVELATRHRLLIVTKGVLEEQMDKVQRSGLAPLFAAVEVVAEKTAAAYRHIAEKYDCEPRLTWMIGNSPKSDINPALAAGLNAVFVPHANTWALEHEPLDMPANMGRLLQLGSFAELPRYF